MTVMALAIGSDVRVEAAAEDVGMSSARLGNVTRLVQRYIDAGKLPGAISLVARRGRVVHLETYGEMDAERHRPMQLDTIFRFYSMTKPIASVGLMMLYEEGHFQLDDPVSKFIPQLAGLKVFAGGTADSFQVARPEPANDDPRCTDPYLRPGGARRRPRQSASSTDARASRARTPRAR